MARYPNILCRVNTIQPVFVVRYVEWLPKEPLAKKEFDEHVELKCPYFKNNIKQACLQWGLYYEENGMCYPRFKRDISEEEAQNYINNWLKKLVVPNPYSKCTKITKPVNLVALIYSYMKSHPDEIYLHDIVNGAFHERMSSSLDILQNTLKQTGIFSFDNDGIRFYRISPKNNGKKEIKKLTNKENEEIQPLLNFFIIGPNDSEDLSEVTKKVYGTEKTYEEIKKIPSIDNILLIEPVNNIKTTLTKESGNLIKDYRDMNEKEYFHLFDQNTNKPINEPLQQIFYGAPGTGKSQRIKRDTEGCDVIRTTFHPDSDYSTFVGAYKPFVDDKEKITYRFVKQAFVQAYICAWGKYSKASVLDGNSSLATASTSVSSSPSGQFAIGDTVFRVTQVSEDRVKVQKDINLKKQSVLTVWKRSYLWINGEFTLPKGPQSGVSLQYSVCKWIYDNLDNPSNTTESFEEGWGLLMQELKKGQISMPSLMQIYTASANDTPDTIHISWNLNSHKKRLEKCFNGEKSVGAEIGLVDILKNLNPESFTDAWEKLRNSQEDNTLSNDAEIEDIDTIDNIENKVISDPVFLIIEEINRGNCAQIFGDLFQLLDRKDGFSEYPIEADSDLQQAIKDAFDGVTDNKEYAIDNINIDYILPEYKSAHGSKLSSDIKNGYVLMLPPNLYIWATMNTSDQSLFPMDSAFKRRWDWEYVPIKYENKCKIEITGTDESFEWSDFQRAINKRILEVTKSEDKQMGDYFIKNGITYKGFLNKVMFYLWNDICKENHGTRYSFFKDENGQDLTYIDIFSDPTKFVSFCNYIGTEDCMILKKADNKEKEQGGTDPTMNIDGTTL